MKDTEAEKIALKETLECSSNSNIGKISSKKRHLSSHEEHRSVGFIIGELNVDELEEIGSTPSFRSWSDVTSTSGSSLLERSCDSEQSFRQNFSYRRQSRRVTVSDIDSRKPWNYGAGGTKYQKLLYPFGKRKRSSFI